MRLLLLRESQSIQMIASIRKMLGDRIGAKFLRAISADGLNVDDEDAEKVRQVAEDFGIKWDLVE
jgi:hypothetical protein